MVTSCFSGRYGDLMTHLQYNVPVVVLLFMTHVDNYCWDCKFTVFAMHCSSFWF